jgi:DNA modification methylase
MYGAGINLQQSHSMIFAGIGFKFRDCIQAVHRIYRFLQAHDCDVHFVLTDAELEVKRALEAKWAKHDELVAQMTALVREHGLARTATRALLARATAVERHEASGANWHVFNNDCVRETRNFPDDHFGLIHTSIPFGNQYDYSVSYLDFGHTDDAAHFWRQMDYLTPELFRVLQPGRVAAVHVKDRIVPGGINGHGFQTLYPFHCDAIAHFQKHGFAFMGMVTIATDVVRENAGTYRLAYTEQCKDGTRQGVGVPEYLLLFRKPQTDGTRGYADTPVVKSKQDYRLARWQLDAAGVWRSSGDRLLAPEDLRGLEHQQIYKVWRAFHLTHVYDYEHHVALNTALEERRALPTDFSLMPAHSAHPDVWTDVARMRTLNTTQASKGREKHICPLQFDIVDRVVTRWSMKGERVYDPFAGIGTVPARAVALGRVGVGTELNARYFGDAARHCRAAEREAATPTLFDLVAQAPAPDDPADEIGLAAGAEGGE